MAKRGPKPKSRAGTEPNTLWCSRCHAYRQISEFYKTKHTPDGYSRECRICTRERAKERYLRNFKTQWRASYLFRRRLREKVLNHYGHKCDCCGEDRYEFLGIDHTEGGGLRHAKERSGATSLVAWLIANNFPPGFRLLCHNCNFSRGHYGYCPHDPDNLTMPVTAASLMVKSPNDPTPPPPRWDNKGGTKLGPARRVTKGQ